MNQTKRKIELLAPGGDIDSIKAAIVAGADAVYCGLYTFNARNRATNICFDDLSGVLSLAHSYDCKIYLTINIILIESEFRALLRLLNRLVNTTLDGVIVQDLGLFYILSKYFKTLKIHASTQLTTHNEGQIKFLSQLAASQINLSRELNIKEISALTEVGHKNDTLIEVFVQGSHCISFSGICYISSVLDGKSGNRGRCSQPCRDQYLTTPEGKNFPLNLKDNSAYQQLRELHDTGVDSIKIEGRVKKFHYVYTVVNFWREQLDGFYNEDKINKDNSVLYKVFNRDFSSSFLRGTIDKGMYIDNSRDNSATHYSTNIPGNAEKSMKTLKKEIYDSRTEIITNVENRINELSLSVLDDTKEKIKPVILPYLARNDKVNSKPTLNVLISAKDDLTLLDQTSARFFFQLPSCFADDYQEFIDLFLNNKGLIPWFPSVLIGQDYAAAVDILQRTQPKLIVTNNTGIAYEAYKRGIDWIAGPFLNIVNSYSLLCLKEEFNAYGSFISNEVSKDQIIKIRTPDNFELYYSIYHPLLLMTSRQCLIHQVEQCEKEILDEDCIHQCERCSSITNLKNVSQLIEKSRGNYHELYSDINFLNPDIVTDLPDMFTGFFIDLREIKTDTRVEIDKIGVIEVFENFLNGKSEAKVELSKRIHPSTNAQYQKGI